MEKLSDIVMFGVSLVITGEGGKEQARSNTEALIEELEYKKSIASEIRLLKLENDLYRSENILKELIQVEEGSLSEEGTVEKQ